VNILFLISIGFAAGCISGMGIGGGAILIPALTIFFGLSQHAAQNINLIYFIPTAVFAIATHQRNKQIETKILPKTITGGVIGAVAGSGAALMIGANALKLLFAAFLLIIGTREFFSKKQ